jgi:hypothetical protein
MEKPEQGSQRPFIVLYQHSSTPILQSTQGSVKAQERFGGITIEGFETHEQRTIQETYSFHAGGQ